VAISPWACHPSIRYPPGGYDYPKQIAAKDANFYFYPMKDSLPRSDSFIIAVGHTFFEDFNEPNLSLRPMATPTFRLTWSPSFSKVTIITLTPHEITIKEGTLRKDYNYPDKNLLTPIERLHVEVLGTSFPIDDTTHHSTRKQHRLDSMGRLYPQLYDPAYYKYLLDKEAPHTVPSYIYTVTKIPITPAGFDSLVDRINTSGYWQWPFKGSCPELPTDAGGITLEANTPEKYKVIWGSDCPYDSISYKQAWQALVNRAGMEKHIQLLWGWKADTVGVIAAPSLPEVKEPVKKKHKK